MYRENDKIKFTLRPDNILHTTVFPNTVMTLEDGKESTRISAEMINNKPVPLLCDLTNVVKMTQECRQHFAGVEHNKTLTKAALIISNPISRILGNFFLGLNKPIKPTRLFTDYDAALKWLKQ